MVNFPKKPSSIDSIVRLLGSNKARAISLIKRHKKGHLLSEVDLEFVAESIYLTTFRTALKLGYSDTDHAGKKGIVEPMDPLVAEVKSYGLKEIKGEFCVGRVGQPAFQFGNCLLFTPKAYEPKKTKKSSRSAPTYLWMQLNSFNPVGVFMKYAAEFAEDKG